MALLLLGQAIGSPRCAGHTPTPMSLPSPSDFPPPAGPVVLAVLFGALLHAAWNALIKSSRDKSLDTALIHSLGSLVALPLLALLGPPPPQAWPFVAASVLLHLGYYTALAGAYRHGDLGLTYPVMRGSAPLLVALGSQALTGEQLSGPAWAGVGTICAGVLMLGLAGWRPGTQAAGSGGHAVALRFALSNAVIIAAYTVVDGLGVRASGLGPGSAPLQTARYVAALFAFDGLAYGLMVLWQRRGRTAESWAYARMRWPLALLGTVASLGSYGIALWAMTRAPVAVVAALRETSVLFAAGISALWLREGFGWRRAAGTLVVVGGVMMLRLG